MSIEEFDETAWRNGMTCVYQGRRCKVVSPDFCEKLLGLTCESMGEEVFWVRCENVTDVVSPARRETGE